MLMCSTVYHNASHNGVKLMCLPLENIRGYDQPVSASEDPPRKGAGPKDGPELVAKGLQFAALINRQKGYPPERGQEDQANSNARVKFSETFAQHSGRRLRPYPSHSAPFP